jgi:hypothetical protein
MNEFEKAISNSIHAILSSRTANISNPKVKELGVCGQKNIILVKLKEMDFWVKYKIDRGAQIIRDYDAEILSHDLLSILKDLYSDYENIKTIKSHFSGISCEVYKEGSVKDSKKYCLKVKEYDNMLLKKDIFYYNVSVGESASIATRIRQTNKTRKSKLREAKGGQASALECCQVSFRLMMQSPDEWKDRLRKAMEDPKKEFRSGCYQPIIRLQNGVIWTNTTLKIRADLPQSVIMGAQGRKLTELVDSNLFEGITVTKIFRRLSDDYTYIRTDASSVKLKPVFDLMGLQYG